jgi:hypothetical protein
MQRNKRGFGIHMVRRDRRERVGELPPRFTYRTNRLIDAARFVAKMAS